MPNQVSQPSSMVNVLLQSNDAPSPAAERLILQEIDRTLQEIKSAEQEMCSLQSRLEDSKNYLQKLNASLSPVRKLPSELIIKILSFLEPQQPVDLYSWSSEPRPWYLGMISRRWRAAALATHSLWASFKLDLDSYYLNIESEVLMMSTYLERSGNHLLTFYVLASEFNPVLDVLCQVSTRWKDVTFMAELAVYQHMSIITGQLPALQKLALRTEFPSVAPLPLNIFEHAPQLQFIEFDTCPSPALIIPWSQIVEIQQFRNFMTDSNALDLLSRLVNLRDCKLWIRGRPQPQTQAVVLPNLRNLVYRGDYVEIFNSLTLPGLEKFYLTDWAYGDMPSVIIAMISRSACSLTHLELGTAYASDAEVIRILKSTPSLVKFSLWRATGHDLGDELFRALRSNSSARQTLLPHLRSVKFTFYRDMPFTNALVEMLEFRTEPPCPNEPNGESSVARLQSVELHTDNKKKPSAAIEARLGRLRRRGIDINIVIISYD